ncbi:hypothetical protein ACFLTP_07510 [Chloroflexota bacterium]
MISNIYPANIGPTAAPICERNTQDRHNNFDMAYPKDISDECIRGRRSTPAGESKYDNNKRTPTTSSPSGSNAFI